MVQEQLNLVRKQLAAGDLAINDVLASAADLTHSVEILLQMPREVAMRFHARLEQDLCRLQGHARSVGGLADSTEAMVGQTVKTVQALAAAIVQVDEALAAARRGG